MRRLATSNAVLEPLRNRFEVVMRDVVRGLAAISAQVQELPEAQRRRLRAVLLDLEGLQLRLQVFVDETADPRMFETAIHYQLDILEKVKAFASLIGRIETTAQASGPVTGSISAYHDDVVAAVEALDRAGRRPAVRCRLFTPPRSHPPNTGTHPTVKHPGPRCRQVRPAVTSRRKRYRI